MQSSYSTSSDDAATVTLTPDTTSPPSHPSLLHFSLTAFVFRFEFKMIQTPLY